MKVIIVGCGSYNPLTIMHLRMFELAKDFLIKKYNYNVIGGIISPVNDHYETKKYLASAKHRCEMIRRALKPLNGHKHWVELDEWESKQDRWIRVVELLDYLQNRANKANGEKVQLKLLCGSDLFESFNVPDLWKDEDIETIVRDYGLVVITREGNDPSHTLRKTSKSPILIKYEQNIDVVEEKVKNCISSTYIREAIANNESIRYLVDDSVAEYIQQHKLYL